MIASSRNGKCSDYLIFDAYLRPTNRITDDLDGYKLYQAKSYWIRMLLMISGYVKTET